MSGADPGGLLIWDGAGWDGLAFYAFAKQEKFKGRRLQAKKDIRGATSPYCGWSFNNFWDEDLGDGSYMYLVVSTNADGSLGGSSATYRYDGNQYPIATLNPETQARISYRRINSRTVEYTVRVDDIVTQIGAKTISPDGRVLTIVIQFPNAEGPVANQILRFDRRR